jgi:hypothetical protein
MLSKSTNYVLDTKGALRQLTITPLFLQNHKQPWLPNEIYEITQQNEPSVAPQNLGKIIVDDHMDWHHEGDSDLTEEEIELVAKFVFSEI